MAQDISLLGAVYSDVPAVDLPKSTSGTARFTDVTDTTTTASDALTGTYFYTSAGVRTAGSLVVQNYYTGSSAPSSSTGSNGDLYLQT